MATQSSKQLFENSSSNYLARALGLDLLTIHILMLYPTLPLSMHITIKEYMNTDSTKLNVMAFFERGQV